MSKRTMIPFAVGLVLVGLFAGVASGQAFQRSRYVNTGLFSVPKGVKIHFSVSLDDGQSGPPIRVLLSILDQQGKVRADDDVTLLPGQSTTLEFQEAGTFRAHARAIEPMLSLSGRRTIGTSVELIPMNDLDIGIREVCTQMSDDNIGQTRPQ